MHVAVPDMVLVVVHLVMENIRNVFVAFNTIGMEVLAHIVEMLINIHVMGLDIVEEVVRLAEADIHLVPVQVVITGVVVLV